MKILINKPQFLSEKGLASLVAYGGEGSKFIGTWSLQGTNGCWTDTIYDVIYLANLEDVKYPSKLVGYTYDRFSYKAFRVNAEPSFVKDNKDIDCILEDDIVYVSRYRHDFVSTPKGKFIDGGRDYTRSNNASTCKVFFDLHKGEFFLHSNLAHGHALLDIEYINEEQ